MLEQVAYMSVPFLMAFLLVITCGLALGMMPALWLFWSRQHYGLLWRWGIVALLFGAVGAYFLPVALAAWKAHFVVSYKPVTAWMGYFVSVLFAPMAIPEPLRMARRRIRQERPADQIRRGFKLPK